MTSSSPLPATLPSSDTLSGQLGNEEESALADTIDIVTTSSPVPPQLASSTTDSPQNLENLRTDNGDGYQFIQPGTGCEYPESCEFVTYSSLFNNKTIVTLDKTIPCIPQKPPPRSDASSSTRSVSPVASYTILQKPAVFPNAILASILNFLDLATILRLRKVSKSWLSICRESRPLKFPSVYYLPVELLQQIFALSTATAFDAARHTCRAWYLSSMEPALLHDHFRAMGFWNADPLIKGSQDVVYLSKRLSRECSLGSDGSGMCRLQKTAVLDFTEIAATGSSHFTVSSCGSFALICEGCVVYVYRLQPVERIYMEFVASIISPRRVLAVSMDTSSRRYSVAILLDGRLGIVHDIVEQEAKSTYRNICSEDDGPRSVAICPQRRCVAFGCQGGIELHWVDALTGQDLNRWFPLTAPSDFLYFLPPRRGIDSAKKLRLISSAAHPNEVNPLNKRFGVGRGSLALWGSWERRTAQSDHYQAIPLSDGYHILFQDPASGSLCLGSDAPLGGPTKLLRKIWLIPPALTTPHEEAHKPEELDYWMQIGKDHGDAKKQTRPSAYASGADLTFGVRIVAGYGDDIVLYSIPPDIFHDVQKEDDDQQHVGVGVVSRSSSPQGRNPPEVISINGCYIGSVKKLVDLAIDSGPEMAVYAFSGTGTVVVYQLEGTSSGETFLRRYGKSGELTDTENGTSLGELAGAPSLDGEGEEKSNDMPWWDNSAAVGERIWNDWERTGWYAEGDYRLDFEV